ncbi:hypothetical protein ACFLUN_00765, partial [Chloroflexota bacterium]
MSDNGEKKGGGCFQQGCGTIIMIAVIVFFIVQCGPELLSYLEGESASPPPSQTSTVEKTEERETTPPIPEPPPLVNKAPLEIEPQETAVQAGVLTDVIEEPPVSDVILVRDYAWEYGG